jgi:hypothetical protein
VLLEEEKELTRRSDELARKRRELPWVKVEKDYTIETEEGTKSLTELFDGCSQLLVYHFMFGPPYTAGCTVCSSIADTLAPQVVHLKARDTTLLLASRAPLEKLLAYRQRMGWPIDWVSSGGSDFNRDLGFLHTEEELSRSWTARSLRSSSRWRTPAAPTWPVTSPRAQVSAPTCSWTGPSTGPMSPAHAASNQRWPTTGCSTAHRAGARKRESSSTGSAGTTSTRRRQRVLERSRRLFLSPDPLPTTPTSTAASRRQADRSTGTLAAWPATNTS